MAYPLAHGQLKTRFQSDTSVSTLSLVHSDTETFVLWNQSRVPETAAIKAKHLRVHPRHAGRCVCGTKFDGIQMAKADATAFFTMVNRKRCLEEIAQAMDEAEGRGHDGFALHREIKSIGKLAKKKKATPRTHRKITFAQARGTLQFLAEDRFFTTGEVVWERRDGLAMGSGASPPITAFDLDHHSRKLFTDKQTARRCGAYVPGIATSRVVQAMLHVDDCIFLSKILCSQCLAACATKLWPPDVSPKIEEVGQSISYLHCTIRAKNGSIYSNMLEFAPNMPNLRFCLGLTYTPKLAKFPQYISRHLQPAKTLQPIIWGKTATITYTCTQITTDALLSICVLVVEPLLLGWPSTVVGAALASYPRAHKGPLANCIRIVGQTLRKCRAAREAHDADRHAYGDSYCNFPWFSLIRRIADFAAQHVGCNTRVQYPESLC